jgi:hypothetical protein
MKFTMGRIIVDSEYANHYTYTIEDNPNWEDFYLMLKNKDSVSFLIQRVHKKFLDL